MVVIQPVDWQELDENFKYIIDLYGRTSDNEVAQVRITGFSPYFYLRDNGETPAIIVSAFEKAVSKKLIGIRVIADSKLDAMSGFNGLTYIRVWKIICPSLWMFKLLSRTCKAGIKIGNKNIQSEDIFETGLPPLLRFFHERDISPASGIEFEADDYESETVDVFYSVHYNQIKSTSCNIPLLVAAYDIEVYSASGRFPVSSNPEDEIIQIGISLRYSNDLLTSFKRVVLVNGTVGSEYISCSSEKDLICKFEKYIQSWNPDVIAGYNTFGFDDGYIADRAERYGLTLNLGRTISPTRMESKKFELASGTFAVRYFNIPGRLPVDLLLSVRREQNLDSYKLDNVANTFLRDKVLSISKQGELYEINTKSTRGLFTGNLVRFDIIGNTINPYADGMKFEIVKLESKKFYIQSEIKFDSNLYWSFAKDDISAKDMFESHHGTSEQREIIAKYCLQDCDLVLTLIAKLDTLVNARGMADVCKVPIQYIFLRGQGIKIYSAVVCNASKRNQIIMNQESTDEDTSYEGAIVLPPKIGMYLDQPIPVLDFNSLYPSNMIAFNLSPDTLVYVKTFNKQGVQISQTGNILNGEWVIDEIEYDTDFGKTVCGFVSSSHTVGILPLTLDILLKKRKDTRKLMETCEDDAQKSVLNGLQLAYKVVANSVYGQCGSRTSPIRKIEVAACTTAAGRARISHAKEIVETEFGAEVIYGDTDSIFIQYPTKSLEKSMELARKTAERITSLCRKPYKIEYEKTFYPFILFCRKRYVGMMYEDDTTHCKRKAMGLVLKRRDNAPIVKDIFGGALDILMEKRNIREAQLFVQNMLVQVLQNKIPLLKFVVTKQLRDDYKNPEQIAHRVLANRMEERDPGNKPQVGDRLSFIYVSERKDKKKQGERIEHLDYVIEHGLTPDVEFYITNQIQNPVSQLFALALEDLEGYKSRIDYRRLLEESIDAGGDPEECTLSVLKQKEKELENILFMNAPYLKKHKRGPMDMFIRREAH